jgi:hypothetical protein
MHNFSFTAAFFGLGINALFIDVFTKYPSEGSSPLYQLNINQKDKRSLSALI